MDPEPDDDAAEGLAIDIDPELIAAAMSAVESRRRPKKRKGFAPSRFQEETGDPVTVDLERETDRVGRLGAPSGGGGVARGERVQRGLAGGHLLAETLEAGGVHAHEGTVTKWFIR